MTLLRIQTCGGGAWLAFRPTKFCLASARGGSSKNLRRPRGSGLLGRLWRPSVAPAAGSFGWDWSDGDHAARAPTASWRTGRNAHSAFAVGCPAMTLCGTKRGSGRFHLHNVMPGTPRWRGFIGRLLPPLPLPLRLARTLPRPRLRVLSVPAFRVALGDPASPGQRGREGRKG